jgi:DNA-binding NarL/FixJ family response regulator
MTACNTSSKNVPGTTDSSSRKVYRVVVVEDLPALREHVTAILSTTLPGVQVISASNGTDGLELWHKEKPDLIVLDIHMPDITGIKVAQQIWLECPSAKILFWSQFHRESYVREIGKIVPDDAIHGYALKTESDEKLAYAITSVLLQDNSYIDPTVRGVQHALRTKDNIINESESAILIDVVLGLTDKAIAIRQHISVRGVQNRISALSDKLVRGLDIHVKESANMEVLNTRARIILEAFRQGFIEPDDLAGLEAELATFLARRFNFESGE